MPGTAPPTDKQLALDALDRLPASATLEQLRDELALLVALRRGAAAADAGQVVSHADVERRSAAWTTK